MANVASELNTFRPPLFAGSDSELFSGQALEPPSSCIDLFRACDRIGRDRQTRFWAGGWHRRLADCFPGPCGTLPPDALAEPWRRVVAVLRGASYRDYLTRVLGHAPGALVFHWQRTAPGTSLDAPEDERLATHLFDFEDTNHWSPDWRGNTRFADGFECAPGSFEACLVRAHPQQWTPVDTNLGAHPRRTLQVVILGS